jgi:hypothetical protein
MVLVRVAATLDSPVEPAAVEKANVDKLAPNYNKTDGYDSRNQTNRGLRR